MIITVLPHRTTRNATAVNFHIRREILRRNVEMLRRQCSSRSYGRVNSPRTSRVLAATHGQTFRATLRRWEYKTPDATIWQQTLCQSHFLRHQGRVARFVSSADNRRTNEPGLISSMCMYIVHWKIDDGIITMVSMPPQQGRSSG